MSLQTNGPCMRHRPRGRSTRTGRSGIVGAGRGHPVVLFADREPWEAFLEFAAALRRRGVRVERLTAADRPRVRRVNDLLQRPVFDRIRPVLHFSRAGEPRAEEVLAHLPAGVRAWEAVDAVAASVAGTADLPLRTADPATELLLFDKLEMTRYATALGLSAPASWPAERAPLVRPPFLVKPRLGSGGQGVEVVVDDVAAARLRHAAPGRLLCQERAPGQLLHVGGVARDGVVLQAASYRGTGSSGAFGPSTEVLTLEDPEAADATATLLRSLRYTGAFCLDFVRAADGRPLLIDVNARIFGSWAALQAAGLDLVGAYLFAWGLSAAPPTGSVPAGRRLRVPPPDLSLAGPQPFAGIIGAHLRAIVRSAPVLGPRWVLSAVCRLLSAVGVQGSRRIAHRLREEAPR
jgi:hypothetical protein